MKVFKSIIAAFATFSRIPLPMVELNSEDCKYSMCFFPMVGLVIGMVEAGAFYLLNALEAGVLLRACIMTAIPLLLTGGIHLDGYCDTSDAFNSYQPKEKKLEIMKDPHIGAFGVIRMTIWLLLYVGFLTKMEQVIVFAGTFVTSRALTALTVVLMKNAKENGMGASEKKTAEKDAVVISSTFWLIFTFVLIMGVSLLLNTGVTEPNGRILTTTFVTFIVAVLWCVRYKTIVYKQLGGFTGDTSGWHLMISELLMTGCIVACSLIWGMVF